MGTHRIIFIRTDGNTQIATGHIMRCLSIAEACQNLGMEVRFLVSDEESAALIKHFSNDAYVTILQTAHYRHLEQELSELTELLQTFAKPVLLVDSYGATPGYFTALAPFARLVYLDDLQAFDPAVDLVINYDVIPSSRISAYEEAYQNAKARLLGASYAPLRNQFSNLRLPLREQARDILVTTGGSDQEHFCLGLLEAFSTLPTELLSPLTFHLVIGNRNTDAQALRQTLFHTDYPCRILLYQQVTDMASLMLSCDLALSAAGTTLYELCALGVPTISFTVADNQLISAEAFAEAEIIPCAGDFCRERPLVYQKLFDYLREMTFMSDNNRKRKSAHTKMCRLIDGKGSERIAKALDKLFFKQ